MTVLESYLEDIQKDEEVNEIAVMTALTAGMLAVSVVDAFKDFISKAARQCYALHGSDRSKCIVKMKVEGQRKLIAGFSKAKADCIQTRNPAKCIEKMNEKISKANEKMKLYQQQLKVVGG